MNDSIRLLVCGVCAAALAWGLLVLLGQYALDVFIMTTLVGLAWENRGLRKRLQATAKPRGEHARDLHGKNRDAGSPSPPSSRKR